MLKALVHDSLGEALVERIGRRLVLGDRHPDFGHLPERLLLVLFASRAGSSYAVRLLANTPHFRRIRECFNPEQLSALRSRHDLPDDRAAAACAVAEYGTSQAFAAKCGASGLAAAYLTGFLEAAWERLQLIRIRRRDEAAQAVSLYRAEITGRFHSMQKDRHPIRTEDYDRTQIERRLIFVRAANERLDSFVERSGKSAGIFHYEDICANPRDFVRNVCALIDLPAPSNPDTKVNIDIVRDEINDAWTRRFLAGR